jgi:hypothetical protein
MKPSDYLAMIEDLEAENKDLRKQLERTSRKLTETQAKAKKWYDALRSIVTKDHPALKGKRK